VLSKPVFGPALQNALKALNDVVSEPMVFLAKTDDPLCLHEAIEYVLANELTQHMVVVHFVDDRPVLDKFVEYTRRLDSRQMPAEQYDEKLNKALLKSFMTPLDNSSEASVGAAANDGAPDSFLLSRAWPVVPGNVFQLIENVALLDAFYSYVQFDRSTYFIHIYGYSKCLSINQSNLFTIYFYRYIRVSSLIVRGTYFCPEGVRWLSRFLNIPLNSMLMGAFLFIN